MHDHNHAHEHDSGPIEPSALAGLTHAAEDTMAVHRVFGEPYEQDGALIIPVAAVLGSQGLAQAAGSGRFDGRDRPGRGRRHGGPGHGPDGPQDLDDEGPDDAPEAARPTPSGPSVQSPVDPDPEHDGPEDVAPDGRGGHGHGPGGHGPGGHGPGGHGPHGPGGGRGPCGGHGRGGGHGHGDGPCGGFGEWRVPWSHLGHPFGRGRTQGSGASEAGAFATRTRPLGVYVVKDGEAQWQPAVDVNRAILGGQIIGALVGLVLSMTVPFALALRRRRR